MLVTDRPWANHLGSREIFCRILGLDVGFN